jgi:hypothetical protein
MHRYPYISIRTAINVQASRAVTSYPKSNDMFVQMVKDCYYKFDITEGKNI